MAMAAMNRINISLIFLIMISMVLPASAIMYASGSTDNSEASDSEFSENRFASDSGSTDNSEGHQIVGLLMIMLIYQQRLWKIISLYPVNLR